MNQPVERLWRDVLARRRGPPFPLGHETALIRRRILLRLCVVHDEL